jgi:cyclase
MLTKRIIPCLDVLDGRVVKGRQFKNLTDVGDPVDLAARYSEEGADEIVVLDISASLDQRKPFFHLVEKIAQRVAIPLTVGGGITAVDDILTLLRSGADKVSLNTILTRRPEILVEASVLVGSQALVAAIDAQRADSGWIVHVKSGTERTAHDAIEWARTVVRFGAGELLVTSIDSDGMKQGYDVALLKTLAVAVNVPLIASGGAGTREHLRDALLVGRADAVLAASMFHFREIGINELKDYLRTEGVLVR